MSVKTKKDQNLEEGYEYVDEGKTFRVKPLKCMNLRQKEFIRAIDSHEITFCTGPAGSGKTYLALWAALKALTRGEFKQIILAKSVTPIPGEDIGFIPGGQSEKMDPFMMSFTGNIDKLVGERVRKKLMEEGKIKVLPLVYIRGINIDDSIVLLDEAQNLSASVFKTIITRIGQCSKYIITGDTEQIDLKNKKTSVLSKVIDLFRGDDMIGTIKFEEEDCVRNPIIPHILEKLKILE